VLVGEAMGVGVAPERGEHHGGVGTPGHEGGVHNAEPEGVLARLEELLQTVLELSGATISRPRSTWTAAR